MAQVGRISGPLLKDNLLRDGRPSGSPENNLTFRNTTTTTQLLHLDVNSGKIGVNTGTATQQLEVDGTTQTTNLIVPNSANTPGYEITNNTFRVLIGDIYLDAAEAVVMANLENDTIRISDNRISTIVSNADIDITPHGTGTVRAGNGFLNDDSTTDTKADVNVFGNIHTPGNITFEGTITFGDADTDDVTFNAEIATDIIPDQGDTFSLGSSSKRWQNLFTQLINGSAVISEELIAGAINFNLRNGGLLFVAQEGDDTNHGDHYLAPFATISRAIQAAEASGDQPFVIIVSPGEYQEALPLVVPPNVSVIGKELRNVIITPDTSSQSEDVFHLNNNSTVSNLTIKNHYYDNVGNTGYAFRFAPGAIISERSPYIQDVTVITEETTQGAGDAGRGAWIDGSEVDNTSIEASMLFHSCTFIVPGADAISMTNGVRVEWLNSFTYYAHRGLYLFDGVTGRTGPDGSTVEYGAELRSIGSANVYGGYGIVADGPGTLAYLIQHNFAYIGADYDNSNNLDDVIQANEVVELNSGQVHYVTTDQVGNFRVGDNFFVNLEDGSTSINIDTGDIDSLTGLVISTGGEDTFILGNYVDTGNIRLSKNILESTVGDINIQAASNTVNINDNVSVTGNVEIIDNLSFGGTLNFAGDQVTDRIDFNVQLEQNFKPHRNSTFNLGNTTKPWLNAFLDKATLDEIIINDNFITTTTSSADLELRTNGTGKLYVPDNNVEVDNNFTTNGNTDLQNLTIVGDITHIGSQSHQGDTTVNTLDISQNINVGSQAQFEEILFDGNVITTTTTSADLELRASSSGEILVPVSDVIIDNNLSARDVTTTGNINIALQTAYNQADVSDVTITQNYITSTAINSDLRLLASSAGKITALTNNVEIENNFTVNGTTTLKNSYFSYEYGPELITNGTFTNNTTGWAQTGGGSATVVAGQLSINAIGSARNVSQSVTVEQGKTYDLTFTISSVTEGSGTTDFYVRFVESGVGDRAAWYKVDIQALTLPATLTGSFVAATNEVDIVIRSQNATFVLDNFSIIEDIGLVENITPVDVSITGTQTQVGNKTQTGNFTQTGDTTITGKVTSDREVHTSNFIIDNDTITNYREGLRYNKSNTYTPLSLVQMVYAMANGDTAADYPGQTEKNIINYLANGTSAVDDYGLSYADVNRDGRVSTADALAWLQYIANDTTGNDTYDAFIQPIADEILETEFYNPGTYNSVTFEGDYYEPDMSLQAAGTGRVVIPNNDVTVTNNVSVNDITANNININQDLELNEIVITDSIIEIDDNFISTTISNADLDLRANRNVVVPTNDTIFNRYLTVDGVTDLQNLNVTGNITQTGNRNQLGNLNVTGTVTVSSTNIESEIQFDNILFNDNFIETTDSNSSLELRAGGTGEITIPSNDVVVDNNITLGTLDATNITISSGLSFEEFELSSDIKLFDNVITTTNSNSNLELRTIGNRSIRLQDIRFNQSTISTPSTDIDITVNDQLIIDATGAVKIPTGTTAERTIGPNRIRFNTTDNVFEGFNSSNKPITFGGVYSSNRLTRLLAHPTNDTITATINNNVVGSVTATGVTIHGLEVDDIRMQNNTIETVVSNSDVDLRANGTGKLILDDIELKDNIINNTNNGSLIIRNTLYGKVKFDDTTALVIPHGTTAERPGFTPEEGMTRWNTQEQVLETWDGNTFISAAGSAATISEAEFEDLILEYTLIFG